MRGKMRRASGTAAMPRSMISLVSRRVDPLAAEDHLSLRSA